MKRAIVILMLSTLACFGQLTIADPGFLSSLAPAAEEGGSISDPTEISDLFLWVSAESASNMTNTSDASPVSDGNDIKTATDLSGNQRHLSGNNAPSWNQSNKGLVFAANERLMVGFSAVSDCTIFAVVTVPSGGSFIFVSDSTNSSARVAVFKDNSNLYSIFSGATLTGSSLGLTKHVLVATFNGSGNDAGYLNGASDISAGNAGSQSLDGLTLGSNQADTTPWGSYIHEYGIYNRILSGSEIDQLEDYLNTTWSVY